MRLHLSVVAVGLALALPGSAYATYPGNNYGDHDYDDKDDKDDDKDEDDDEGDDECTDIADLGAASGYNLFLFGDFDGQNADIAGRAAIGDDAVLLNYGVGTSASGNPVLAVGDHLTATNGQVYNGDAEVGGACTTSAFNVPNGSLSCNDAGAFDASDYRAELEGLSAAYSALVPNGTTSASSWGGLTLTGTDPVLNVFEVDLDMLAFDPWVATINTYTISVPAGSTVIVNVLGDTGRLFQYAGFNLSGATPETILWNLEYQTDLTITGIAVQGSILAPQATVAFNGAALDGTLVAENASGGGQYHDHLFQGGVCAPPVPEDPEPPEDEECPTDGSLGTANGYNLFVTGTFNGLNSDVWGTAAIGGDTTLENYSIGSQLVGAGVTLSVGEDLTAKNASVYAGDVEAKGNCSFTNFNTPSGIESCNDASAFDAGDYQAEIEAVSAWLSSLPINGTTTAELWGGLFLTGTDPNINVFEVDLDALVFNPGVTNIVSYNINVPAGSTVVVNVLGGTSRLFQSAGFSLTGATANDIVWNFETQTALTVTGISVQGSILAPKATLWHDGANIEGNVIVANASGGGQYHDFAFSGDICQ